MRKKVKNTYRMKAAQNRPDVKLKKSKSMLGNKNPAKRPEVREKMRIAKLGKKRSKNGKTWSWTQKAKQKQREWKINNPNRKFSNTSIEQKIAKELDKRGILYEQNIGLANIANVDFYLPAYKIIIECDGCYYHNCLIHYPEHHKETRIKDKIKIRLFQYVGFNVYRFWEHDINDSAEDCLKKLNI